MRRRLKFQAGKLITWVLTGIEERSYLNDIAYDFINHLIRKAIERCLSERGLEIRKGFGLFQNPFAYRRPFLFKFIA